jgi:4-hydroxythreonine-4-phosphate dehydrogenase
MGDPAGCGPQITGLAWRSRVEKNLTPFAVVSAPDVYRGYAPVVSIDDPSETDEAFSLGLPVLTPPGFNIGSYATGTPSAPTALAIIESIRWATQATIDGKARAVVTNPISKAVLYDAGFKHPGHTEFIANICKDPTEWPDVNPIMMLVGGGLKVALATIHVPLSEAISSVTQERLISVADGFWNCLTKDCVFRAEPTCR